MPEDRAPSVKRSATTVGLLALQGDFVDHERVLTDAGLATRRIRRPADLQGIDALVLPGGESTTMLKLLAIQQLEEPLVAAIRSGLPTLATCAGLILCARAVAEPSQRSFGVIEVDVARNGYGRQIASGTFDLTPEPGSGLASPLRGIFIRAPRVTAVGPRCRVLARRGEDPVLVLQGAILGACFHPELEPDHPATRKFISMILYFWSFG